MTTTCRQCSGPILKRERGSGRQPLYCSEDCRTTFKRKYWREHGREIRAAWTPEQRAAYTKKSLECRKNLPQEARKAIWRRGKVLRAVRQEARERGVDPSVIRAEWRVI